MPLTWVKPPEFSDPDLQEFSDKLVADCRCSGNEALKVCGLIEDVDMDDIRATIDWSTKSDIDDAYVQSTCGSRKHLRAYAAAFEAGTSAVYEAQLPDQDAVEAIPWAPREDKNVPA
jgi:hypothetical protein